MVNESFDTAQKPVRQDVKKSQWFIVSLMRLVQKNN